MDAAKSTVGPKLNTSSEFDNYTTRNPLNTFQRNSTDTVTDDEIERLSVTMSKVQTVLCPTLFIVGILGNCFVISTVSHGQFRHMTVRIILLALALSDCLLLSTNPFNQRFMQDVMGRDVRSFHTVTCKLFFIVYRLGKTTSSWFVVMIAVERFVAVLFPLKVKTVLTKRNIAVAVASVYGVILVLHSVWTVTTDINDRGICVPDYLTPETMVFHKTMTVIAVAFYSLIPLAILLVVTPPIIVKLLRLHRVRKTLNSNRGGSRADMSRASAMLITVVLAYVVWVTPITIVLVSTVWTGKPVFGSKNKKMIILEGVALSFEQVNHSCNFLIYILLSSQFRQRFLQIVRCRCKNSDSLTGSLSGTRDNVSSVNGPSTVLSSAFDLSDCAVSK